MSKEALPVKIILIAKIDRFLSPGCIGVPKLHEIALPFSLFSRLLVTPASSRQPPDRFSMFLISTCLFFYFLFLYGDGAHVAVAVVYFLLIREALIFVGRASLLVQRPAFDSHPLLLTYAYAWI